MKYILIALAALLLSACQPQVIIRPVVQEKHVPADVPAVYTEVILLPEPPSKEVFMSLGQDEREDALVRYILSLNLTLFQVNSDRALLRDHLTRQKKLIEDFNTAEEARIKKLKEAQK